MTPEVFLRKARNFPRWALRRAGQTRDHLSTMIEDVKARASATIEDASATIDDCAFAIRIARTNRRRIFEAPSGRMGIPGLIDLGLDGFLWPQEARMLYETARNGRGNILELGTFRGLSSLIMSTAVADRGGGEIHTCDIDAATSS